MDDDLTKLRAIMRRYHKLAAVRGERDREIAALVAQEVARERICQVVGLTREQLRRIVNAERERRAADATDARTGPQPPR